MTSLRHDDLIVFSDGDVDTNPSTTTTLGELVEQRYSRRQMMGGMSAMTTAAFGASLLSACGSDANDGDVVTVSDGTTVQTQGGRVVTLTSTASGNATSTQWSQVSGPTVALTTSGTSVSFVAPNVTSATNIVLQFTASSGSGSSTERSTVVVSPATLDFTAVAKNKNDIVTVPSGYTVTVLYRCGDPLASGVAAYANDGTDSNFAQRAGDNHDGMSYFGLAASGSTPDASNNTRGLLTLNHEYINPGYMHVAGQTIVNGVRTVEAEVVKEIEAHGVSVVEVTRAGNTGVWSYVPTSSFNRRITPNTPVAFSGPLKGDAMLRTVYAKDGTTGRGTINNCANGALPWGDYATCEENWAGYFRRDAGDATVRTAANNAKQNVSLSRYGIGEGAKGNHLWSTVTPADASSTVYRRWNATASAALAADGTADFRNEPYTFGWVVEIDPYNPASTPRKRTALGRMAHEGVMAGRVIAGVKPAFYMGDDGRNEYIYKFVSATPWSTADATPSDRLATGDKYLDTGTLYVAKFNADGSGQWLPLVFGQNGLDANNARYPFASQADVLANARIAGDALGATPMDRPEWTAVNPVNGEMYCTLTNNSQRRGVANSSSTRSIDAANPRAYVDTRTDGGTSSGNANGHVVRLREANDSTESTSFTWDVYAFGARSTADAANVNLSGLDATNDFSSPDGLWFGLPTNAAGQAAPLLFVQTDDGAYTDVTNCMMLIGMPGRVGDGTTKSVTSSFGGTATVTTRVGAAPGAKLKRFLVGPKECEITGITSTADGRTIFINVQHPGEDGNYANITSNWPQSQATGTGTGRPRAATVVITKNDGGVVGL
ncbi:alkaline phosphatase PhoX [uncultured Sphingomonas sp.]|uniref:alkaline phosphatase PhoX n=1 Tax=uncultured Sphingomonas sp. TaxID=158754 RepID=UPI0037481D3B